MTVYRYYIGSMGPYLYDDTIDLLDPEGDFIGETQSGFITDGAISAEEYKIAGALALRLLATDANKKITTVTNLTNWIAGTINQITVTDDADGTVTLSLPQDIDTGAEVEFDYIGIGIASPTARLHLPAGTATAGTAPLKFTEGTLLTTPEPGVMNYSDDKFWLTCIGTQRVIDRTSDVKLTTTTVTNTTDETLIYTGLVPADSLKAGNILKLYLSGEIDEAAASDVCTIRVKFAGITIASIASPGTGLAAKCWHISGIATIRSIGATGSMAWHMDMFVGPDSADACDVTVVDTTAGSNVTVTAQWSTAKAGNIFTCTQGFMEYKN